jgi:hypothetical protein
MVGKKKKEKRKRKRKKKKEKRKRKGKENRTTQEKQSDKSGVENKAIYFHLWESEYLARISREVRCDYLWIILESKNGRKKKKEKEKGKKKKKRKENRTTKEKQSNSKQSYLLSLVRVRVLGTDWWRSKVWLSVNYSRIKERKWSREEEKGKKEKKKKRKRKGKQNNTRKAIW